MDSRFSLNKENNTCSIFPGVLSKHPNGLNLTYDECPERFDNSTAKAIRYCCFWIMDNQIQTSYLKKTQDWLRYNSSSVLVIPAVLFNLLSLVVLIRFQKQRGSTKTSTTFYMECLCIFDMLTILSKFLNEVIVVRNGLREDPIVINSFTCKALSFSESSCAICSIYLLIAMSIDKLICVLAPLKVGQLLTPTKAKIIFSFIFVFSVCISSYNLFDKIVFEFEVIKEDSHETTPRMTTRPKAPLAANDSLAMVQQANQHLSSNGSSNGAGSGSGSGHKINNYDCASSWTAERINDLTLIDNIIRVFLPVILLCVCNFWIALALAKARKNTEALFQDNSSSSRNDEMLAHMSRHLKPKESVGEKMRRMLRLDRSSRSGRRGNKKNSTTNAHNNDDVMRKSSAYDYTYNENESDDENEFDDETTNCGSKSSQMEVASVSARPTRSSIANLEATGMVHTHKKSIAHIRGRNSTQHISLMLFAVSMGFICLNLPFAIKTVFHRQFAERYKILDLYHSNDLFSTTTTKSEIDAAVKFEFFSMLTHLLLDLNYIANFFLYFFSGSRFRAQLYSMLCTSCDDEKQKSISRYRNNSQNSKSVKLNENKAAKKSYNPVVYIKYSLVKKNDRGVCDNEPTVCIGSRRPSSNISGAVDAKRLSVHQATLKNGAAKTLKNNQSSAL